MSVKKYSIQDHGEHTKITQAALWSNQTYKNPTLQASIPTRHTDELFKVGNPACGCD